MKTIPPVATCVRATRAVLGCGLLCALLLADSSVFAHSDEYFDSRPSAHGGQTRMAGPIHLELVAGAQAVTVYITDHADRPQPTAGGKAVLRVPARKLRLDLAPSGENAFSAPLAAALPTDTEIVVFVRLAGAEAQAARFGPAVRAGVTPKSADHGAHHDHH